MEISASLLNTKAFHVLIPAAGSGVRMGEGLPKQYRKVQGKTILRHTIEVFLKCSGLKSLRVIIDPSHEKLYQDSVQGLDLPSPLFGGKSRRESTFSGIKSFSDLKDKDIILIHDAVRPLVQAEDIGNIVETLGQAQAATLAVPVADTLRRMEGDIVDREGLWAVQTPQGFHYGVIRDAHEKADTHTEYTDDTAMVSEQGVDVVIVKGHRQNFKITNSDDMEMAEFLLAGKENLETRTGTGFDVHAFTEGNSVRLCGIDIPHDKTLAGHSDADVGLHALTDALLGALAMGDIGEHFPPSDDKYKDTDSSVFIQKAVQLVEKRGGRILNLDLTLICEKPAISPHRQAMRERVADICGISENRVSIKATTTEGLGYTGRGEGIAAQATATIEIPAS